MTTPITAEERAALRRALTEPPTGDLHGPTAVKLLDALAAAEARAEVAERSEQQAHSVTRETIETVNAALATERAAREAAERERDEAVQTRNEAEAMYQRACERAEKAEAALAIEQNDRRLAFAQCQEAKRARKEAEAACAAMREALASTWIAVASPDRAGVLRRHAEKLSGAALSTDAGKALRDENQKLRWLLEQALEHATTFDEQASMPGYCQYDWARSAREALEPKR